MAAETMVFDSTLNYIGACQLTNKSEWELKENLDITKFQIWYNWTQGETTLPVKVFLNGNLFAEFSATRSSCDPYQTQWCNADYQINKTFPAGKYSTEIQKEKQCLKPGGTGTVRLYSEGTPSPTQAPAKSPEATIVPVQNSVQPTQVNTCSCNKTTIVTVAAVTSLISSAVITILLKKKG